MSNFWFVLKVGIVEKSQLLGVHVTDLMHDDVDGEFCGTAEYPLLTTINYALRNNMSRQILTKTEYSGLLR
jgi:hypothetical protein